MQSIPIHDSMQIIIISRVKKDEETVVTYRRSGEEIEKDLSAALLDCLRKYSIYPISGSKNIYMTKSFDHIFMWLQRTESSDIYINISSKESYSNVMYDEQYFKIENSANLLQEVNALLEQKTSS